MLMQDRGQTDGIVSGLVSELGRAWDGLDALAQIIAARGGVLGPGTPVLHRLLETASIGRPEVCSAVWRMDGESLAAVAQFGCSSIDSRVRLLAKRCGDDGQTRVNNADGSEVSGMEGIAPRMIATVGRSPSGSRAVLGFWSPADSAPFDSHTVRIAEALALQVALVFEEEEWRARLLHQERADADLEAARQIQASLLESPRSGECGGLSWTSFSKPSRVVGGDFHDVNLRSGGGLDVIVGDVMGKGLPAAVLGAACLNHVLRATAMAGPDGRPAQILTRANQTLTPELVRLETFASVVLARIDADPFRLTIADAGQGNVAIRTADGVVHQPRGAETLLGVEREAFRERVTVLSPGDLVLIHTDGLTDMAHKSRRVFDAAAWLAKAPVETPAELAEALAQEIEGWSPKGDAPDDDITFVALGRARS